MMLEEAGAETIGTIAATLKLSDQRQFSAQVDELVTLGFRAQAVGFLRIQVAHVASSPPLAVALRPSTSRVD